MRFWEYLKKESVDPEYEESKKRIMELHHRETLSYVNGMFRLDGDLDEMDVDFVKGTFCEGDEAILYDAEGKKSGIIMIESIFYSKDEHKNKHSSEGDVGRIVFRTKEQVGEQFWNSQYVVRA